MSNSLSARLNKAVKPSNQNPDILEQEATTVIEETVTHTSTTENNHSSIASSIAQNAENPDLVQNSENHDLVQNDTLVTPPLTPQISEIKERKLPSTPHSGDKEKLTANSGEKLQLKVQKQPSVQKQRFLLPFVITLILCICLIGGLVVLKKQQSLLQTEVATCHDNVETALKMSNLRPCVLQSDIIDTNANAAGLYDPLWQVYGASKPLFSSKTGGAEQWNSELLDKVSSLESQLTQQKLITNEMYYRMKRWQLIARFYWNEQYGVDMVAQPATAKEFLAQAEAATDTKRPYTEALDRAVSLNSMQQIKYNSFLIDGDNETCKHTPSGSLDCEHKRMLVPCYIDDYLTPHPLQQHVEPILKEAARLRENVSSCTAQVMTSMVKLGSLNSAYEKQRASNLKMQQELVSMSKVVNESNALLEQVLRVAGKFDLNLQRLLLQTLGTQLSVANRPAETPSVNKFETLSQTVQIMQSEDEIMGQMLQAKKKKQSHENMQKYLKLLGAAVAGLFVVFPLLSMLVIVAFAEKIAPKLDGQRFPHAKKFVDKVIITKRKLFTEPRLKLKAKLDRMKQQAKEKKIQKAKLQDEKAKLQDEKAKLKAMQKSLAPPRKSLLSRIRKIVAKAVAFIQRLIASVKKLLQRKRVAPAKGAPVPAPPAVDLPISIPTRKESSLHSRDSSNSVSGEFDDSLIYSPAVFAPHAAPDTLSNYQPKNSNAVLSMKTVRDSDSVHEYIPDSKKTTVSQTVEHSTKHVIEHTD